MAPSTPVVRGTAYNRAAALLSGINVGGLLRASSTAAVGAGVNAISNTISTLPGELVISFIGFTGQDGSLTDPVPGPNQTLLVAAPAWRGPGDDGGGIGLSSQVGAGTQTNSWTAIHDHDLGQLDLAFNGCS